MDVRRGKERTGECDWSEMQSECGGDGKHGSWRKGLIQQVKVRQQCLQLQNNIQYNRGYNEEKVYALVVDFYICFNIFESQCEPFNSITLQLKAEMLPQQPEKIERKPSQPRRKNLESLEFQSDITLCFDEFFRYFNYYYPGKNKQEILNKCVTGNTYWITLDALYYPHSADLEREKIAIFRRKTQLKNGLFPPTRDSLEEEKFILFVRKLVAKHAVALDLDLIKGTQINQVIDYLEEALQTHENEITRELTRLLETMDHDHQQTTLCLERLHIPPAKASNLFAYEHLEKEVISKSVQKAELKEKEPRCDFCFLREKDIIKCVNCDLYTHSMCFARAPKDHRVFDYLCDGCIHEIPHNAQCQLCPILNGHFLQLSFDSPSLDYCFVRGEGNLKFKIIKTESPSIRERKFVHVSCYVLRPELTYNLNSERVEGFHLIDRSRKNASSCSICGNMVGITVSCNNESCRRSYHPECAKRSGLSINVIRANNKALLQIYCQRHKKPETYEYLRDSVTNRIKELRKFYQNLDYELKKYGIAHHTAAKPKKPNKMEELLKQDRCLLCGAENDFQSPIVNCMRCYGWRHETCCGFCPFCDS